MDIHSGPNTAITSDGVSANDPGGGHSHYRIEDMGGNVLTEIHFQDGTIGVNGVNGVQIDDLLHILLHRLDCYQDGAYKSTINAITRGYLAAAKASDQNRTRGRESSGIEGTLRP